MSLCNLSRCYHLFLRNIFQTENYIVVNSVVKQDYILVDNTKKRTQITDFILVDRDSIQEKFPFGDVIKAG